MAIKANMALDMASHRPMCLSRLNAFSKITHYQISLTNKRANILRMVAVSYLIRKPDTTIFVLLTLWKKENSGPTSWLQQIGSFRFYRQIYLDIDCKKMKGDIKSFFKTGPERNMHK